MPHRIRAGDPVIRSADLRAIREGIRKDNIESAVMDVAMEVLDAAEQGKTSLSYAYEHGEYQGKWHAYSGGKTFYYIPSNKEVEEGLRIKFPDCIIRTYADDEGKMWVEIDWSS